MRRLALRTAERLILTTNATGHRGKLRASVPLLVVATKYSLPGWYSHRRRMPDATLLVRSYWISALANISGVTV